MTTMLQQPMRTWKKVFASLFKKKPFLSLIYAAVATSPAFGHAMLQTAVPPVGSTVAVSPPTLTLNFSEELEPHFSTIIVSDGHGTRMDKNDLHIAPGNAKQVIIDLQPLPPGDYKVAWHAVSVDTHKTQGNFMFTVGK